MSLDDLEKRFPQFPEAYWRASTTFKDFPKCTSDEKTDVCIVGAGITGITCGYLLQNEGFKVTIIDAGKILNGTTGHTTAKITAQHNLFYDELIGNFGDEKAKLYYQANADALNFIKDLVLRENIDCDLRKQDAYVYTNSDDYVEKIKNEMKAYEKLGINGELVENTPLPFNVKVAVVMKDQAQFHPLKYLSYLVEDFVSKGGKIYENTTAIDIEDDTETYVLTKEKHKIYCSNIVVTSHFPFKDTLGFYFARLHAYRSYVLAVKTEKDIPDGMYINAEEPSRSIRYADYKGTRLALIGGENHKTGQGICTMKHYEALEQFAKDTFGVNEILYRWSTQDLTSLDRMPYIGKITEKHDRVFVATGYRKWGMTTSTFAAHIINDIITGRENPYVELFSPSRFNVDPSLKAFITTNTDVAKHLISGKLEFVVKTPEELENEEGSVVRVNGKRAGAYRDETGELHIVDTTCMHLGCETEWNSGERTWDCPCHGSRYSIDGEVIEGPTKKPLKKIALD
jgi:glycine/D-amino acid oxidase-like deaminating enzyme/nitrite reductase/ring-hydroxylating ferredoxin subunit